MDVLSWDRYRFVGIEKGFFDWGPFPVSGRCLGLVDLSQLRMDVLSWDKKITSGRCPGLIRFCSMLSGASFANGVLDF